MLLLEFMGIVLICMTSLITHHNPILVGLSVTTALYLGDGRVQSYFSPLVVGMQYGMGRMILTDAFRHLAIQSAAILAVILAYKF